MLAERIAASTIEEFAERWGRNPLFWASRPGGRGGLRDRLRDRHGGPGRWRCAASVREPGSRCGDLLGELRMPVALVGVQRAGYRKLAECMPAALPQGADALVVPAVGHAVHLGARGSSPRRSRRLHRREWRVEASRAPRPPAPARVVAAAAQSGGSLLGESPGPPDGAQPPSPVDKRMILRRHHAAVGGGSPPARCRPVRGTTSARARASGHPARPSGDPAPRRGAVLS